MKKKLTTTVSLRLHPDEAADWHSRAEQQGLSLSDFLRSFVNSESLTGVPTPVKVRKSNPAYSPIDPNFLFALSKIGNNLNQVARWANANKTALEAVQIIAYLSNIEDSIISLRNDFAFLPSVERPAMQNSDEFIAALLKKAVSEKV